MTPRPLQLGDAIGQYSAYADLVDSATMPSRWIYLRWQGLWASQASKPQASSDPRAKILGKSTDLAANALSLAAVPVTGFCLRSRRRRRALGSRIATPNADADRVAHRQIAE